MKTFYPSALSFLFVTALIAQPDLNVSLVGHLDYDKVVSDVWGYVAPDGNEYALVCHADGISIVSLADPSNPIEVQFVEGINSPWRDIKTWENFAYVTNEGGDGLMIIELSNLPGEVTASDWAPTIPELGMLNTCHNLYIDEFGYAYLSGCNLNSGGMIYVDVVTSPGDPTYLGHGPAVYSHDVFVKNNVAYSADMINGSFSVHDVSDKANSVALVAQSSPFRFTHNVWLSESSPVLFTTDETAGAPIGSYDVSNLDEIIALDEFRPLFNRDRQPSPHNVFEWDDFLIVSYYTEGCIVVDAAHPDNLIQVGNFDTYFGVSGLFSGAWGVYPYLPSGLIILTDIGNGLYVLEPNYVRACYLEGKVTDMDSGDPIFDANIELGDELNIESTDRLGEYKTGTVHDGLHNVKVSKIGYTSFEASVTLVNGEVVILDAQLEVLPKVDVNGEVLDAETGEALVGVQVVLNHPEVSYETVSGQDGTFLIEEVFQSDYEVYAGQWGYLYSFTASNSISENNSFLSLEMEKGYEDIFLLHLGWKRFTTANIGGLELAVPPKPIPAFLPNVGSFFWKTGHDSPNDAGNGCYFTDVSGPNPLIGGNTTLISPVFDISDLEDPWIAYESWFFNPSFPIGSEPFVGNDHIMVTISNGIESKILELVIDEDFFDEQAWKHSEFRILDELEPTENMQITFQIGGGGSNDLTEAGIDFVRVWDNIVTATNFLEQDAVNVKVFPNPSSSTFRVDYPNPNPNDEVTLYLFDPLGRRIEVISLDTTGAPIEVGEHLEKGVYFLCIQDGERSSRAVRLVKN